jgi:hypothetical protein
MQMNMTLRLPLFFAVSTLLAAAPASADTAAIFELPSGVAVRIIEAPFKASLFKLEGCADQDSACRINGRVPFGTPFGLPKTYVKSIIVSFRTRSYSLDASDMYDAWGARDPEIPGVIRYFGGRCLNAKHCRFRGLFSDAAGTFVAEWLVVNGISVRTVLTASGDVIRLFTQNIDPSPDYSEADEFGVLLDRAAKRDVISPDGQWFVSVEQGANGAATLMLNSATSENPRRLLTVQRLGWVLWSPDSRRFALTEMASDNHFVGSVWSVDTEQSPCQDASSVLLPRLRQSLAVDSKLDKVSSRALTWITPDQLLIGLHGRSFRSSETRGKHTTIHYHFKAIVLDAVRCLPMSELNASEADSKIGRSLESLKW